MAAPLPPVVPEWSPVTQFGGYHASPTNRGLEQALAVSEVAMAADEVRDWRIRQGVGIRTEDASRQDESC